MPSVERARYRALVESDGGAWFVQIVERPEIFGKARSIAHAERVARDLVAAWDDVPGDTIEIVVLRDPARPASPQR